MNSSLDLLEQSEQWEADLKEDEEALQRAECLTALLQEERDGTSPIEHTHMGLAQLALQLFPGEILYVPGFGECAYHEGRYDLGPTGPWRFKRRIVRAARSILWTATRTENRQEQSELIKWGRAAQADHYINGAAGILRTDPKVLTSVDQLDTDPDLLNTPAGTFNLETGERHDHRQLDLLTKISPISPDPTARPTRWLKTLRFAFDGDEEKIGCFHRLMGYAASGHTSENLITTLYGTGANSKTTVTNVIQRVLGNDYAMTAAPGLLLKRPRDTHLTSIADLFGKRLVLSYEMEGAQRLDEQLLKSVTGGDRIRARKMRQDAFEFDPSHTPLLIVNHKPELRGTDHGLWRRILIFPFTVTVPEEDRIKGFADILLEEEGGAILQWLIDGAAAWYERGVDPPDSLRAATQAYRDESDVLGGFIEERCVELSQAKAAAGFLYKAYQAWAAENGESAISAKAFGMRLKERGFRQKRTPSTRYWLGLGLQADGEHDA